jgi:hypothetical protein
MSSLVTVKYIPDGQGDPEMVVHSDSEDGIEVFYHMAVTQTDLSLFIGHLEAVVLKLKTVRDDVRGGPV